MYEIIAAQSLRRYQSYNSYMDVISDLIMHDSFSIKNQIENSPALKSGTKDYDDFWTLDFGGILNVYGDLTEIDIERINNSKTRISLVQFARQFPVSEQTLRLLNDAVFSRDKSTRLRETFNGYGAFKDLQFLKYLSNLKCFGFSAFYNIDLSPIRDFVELSDFGIGGYNISLTPIEGYKHLTSFGFGDKIKDTKIISSFNNLENLGISSQNLKNLDFILPLKRLKRISFSLGGTVEFNNLSLSQNIELIDIWRTKKLEMEHLAPLNEIQKLKILKLRELPRIDSFDWLLNPSLQTLVVEELKGLKSFDSLKGKNIKTLVIKDRLDKAKILSLGSLDNIESIQVYKWYLDNHSNVFSILPNRNSITEIEPEYLK